MNQIELTHDDWVEISSALSSKIGQIQDGDLGGESHETIGVSPGDCYDDCEACSNEKWIKHLQGILNKIDGPDGDGHYAACSGVMPCGK